ncbi:uncharacterized protein TEOVI_000869900 [Trypanosoma equiperdum]|uniref:Uncharacterized protein n=4 Tax=Trypanozoon TaxID=39700 RepID=Q582S6_TRYB2|nr:hypothetical protein, conserved [Trypanosoma brucei gambiense DAL972]XP_844051.1 hypothetical protein, conserved [Trypanosoma brucei brucei TREU927]AAX80628.1 hypothetical protein, conserved [Trypanosoma brucei]RHW73856.1 hypothetical protein DPX39_030045600 [Trypanosoma brucei equiperdum]SCU67263.1 hypothetical protein, conserved [Trypanosoma equiperdum]AAZ10492.1 hypothetical protein, conserved [Trypanosoma brucei brucei TREU927]CBH10168.1 hypothetical protein, conserved [Trypanosoma bru|eukprot:XP_011772458.1 hypothetical protein, conserved [Trypanosoma brucei gambiense DAL972]
MGGAVVKNYDKKDHSRGSQGTPSRKSSNSSKGNTPGRVQNSAGVKDNTQTSSNGGNDATLQTGFEMFVRKAPVVLKPLPQPKTGCLLPSKYIPQALPKKADLAGVGCDDIKPLRKNSGQLAESLSGKRLGAVDGEDAIRKSSPKAMANGQWVSCDDSPGAADASDASSGSETFTYSIDFPGMRSLPWFNANRNRGLVKRRERPPSISWNEEEEIAISDASDKEDNKTGETETGATRAVAPANADGEVGAEADAGTTEGDEPKPAEKPERPRHRPILLGKIPHRKQLAKKALEDNAIFASTRFPKF